MDWDEAQEEAFAHRKGEDLRDRTVGDWVAEILTLLEVEAELEKRLEMAREMTGRAFLDAYNHKISYAEMSRSGVPLTTNAMRNRRWRTEDRTAIRDGRN
ncbi:hypothetical protein ACT3SZ_11210 [Corynebacterium sp. AOP40-9SA-29]|uniref:hypothetical protein n=1 Tax=Corynebacterium sp. AOP40-9SA-29 TaxID=3457677 RepID=UPI004033A37B